MASPFEATERIFQCSYCHVKFTRKVRTQDIPYVKCARSCSSPKAKITDITDEFVARNKKLREERLARVAAAEAKRKSQPQLSLLDRRAKRLGLI